MFYLEVVQRTRRLTQLELARRSGVPQSTISAILRGRVIPTAHELQRLAAALDCPDDADRLMTVVPPLAPRRTAADDDQRTEAISSREIAS